MSQRLQVRLLSIFVLFVAWEYFGRRANPILFTYPTAVIRAFIGLVTSGELQAGATGIAAPVRGVEGLDASVGIVTLGELDVETLGPKVAAAADEVARALT